MSNSNPIFVAGPQFLDRLCKAIGIEGQVKRVVIDVAVDTIAMVYIQRFLEEPTEPLLDAMRQMATDDVADWPQIVECREIDVDEKGNVFGH